MEVKHSRTIFFKSNAPALLPWYNIANSPDTLGKRNELICETWQQKGLSCNSSNRNYIFGFLDVDLHVCSPPFDSDSGGQWELTCELTWF